MKKPFLLILLVFLVFAATFLSGEELVLICNNLSPQNTLHKDLEQLTDSLTQKYDNVFEISSFPYHDQKDYQICFFNPSIFSCDSLSGEQQILSTNIQSSDSSFFECIPYKPAMLDTHSVVFISITTPDFPLLYKKYSSGIELDIDIFDRVNEICKVCEKFGVDYIIAVNYLGDFLSNELLQKIPQLDLVIDYFSLDNNHHYMKEIANSHLINWNRKKGQLLMIDLDLSDDLLGIRNISLIK